MNKLIDWIDHRTGARKLVQEALFENVPGGSRWRYVWGSTLTFALFVQFITGLLLWTAYSPSATSAWESVYYIQYQMWGGWLLRGIHHYTANFMTILLVLHLMQVVIDGAYKAPREVNYWFGVGLLFLVLGLSLTGYLLPWDQKGYWATKVATSIAAITPVIGNDLQRLIIGGSDYGHHTLTRFFALHAGVLPALVVLLVVGHIYLFRRHGITPKKPLRRPDAAFWPDQVLKDAVACLAVFAAILFCVIYTHGAGLSAPADPSEPFNAARPEWYFMFLFQFLKYFPQGTEIWGAIIIPTFLALFILLVPLIANWKHGHRINLAGLSALLAGVLFLTWAAYNEDGNNPEFARAKSLSDGTAERAIALADANGIPPAGAVALLRNDPLTQGPKLFAQHCASCHRYDGHDGLGGEVLDASSAPDLADVATREWLAGFFDPEQIVSEHYWGGTAFAERSDMVRYVQRDVAEFDDTEREQLTKLIAALSAEAQLPAQADIDARDAELIAEGRALYEDVDVRCLECHNFHTDYEDAEAPDLTGYGSRDWLIDFIGNPEEARFYGERNDRMPAFLEDGILSRTEVELIVDWLRHDYEQFDSAGE